MKALSETIKTIDTKRLPEILSAVTETDKLLQDFSGKADKLAAGLAGYGAANQGIRFEKAISTVNDLQSTIYCAAKEVNGLQNSLAEALKQRGNAAGAKKPNSFRASSSGGGRGSAGRVNVTKAGLADAENRIAEFTAYAGKCLKAVKDKKKEAAGLWRDADAFSAVVDNLTRDVTNGTKALEEFRTYLKNCMKNLP